MSGFKMWALADGFVPQKLDIHKWSFADATAYFEQYELTTPTHVIEYAALEQANEKIKDLERENEELKQKLEATESALYIFLGKNKADQFIEALKQANTKA